MDKVKTVTVTIGRNIGTSPMLPELWYEFISKVRQAFTDATSEVWTVAPYKGLWQENPEEACVFYGPVRHEEFIPALRTTLANLATYYHQDAIGMSVGESELVESWQTDKELITT